MNKNIIKSIVLASILISSSEAFVQAAISGTNYNSCFSAGEKAFAVSDYVTYTGYLRKNGFKFSVSSTPSYEDPEFLEGVMEGEDSKSLAKKLKKIEKEQKEKREKEPKPGSMSTLRVA